MIYLAKNLILIISDEPFLPEGPEITTQFGLCSAISFTALVCRSSKVTTLKDKFKYSSFTDSSHLFPETLILSS